MIESIIGAGGSLLSGLMGNLFQQRAMKKQFDYNSRLQKQSNDFTEYMWDKQADYNSPEHMVEMYKEAGLNPGTLAGQGGAMNATPANSGADASVSLPQTSFSDIGASYLQGMQVKSEADKNIAEAQNINQQTQHDADLHPLTMENIQANTNKLNSEAYKFGVDAEQVKTLTPLIANLTDKQCKQVSMSITKIYDDMKTASEQRRLLQKEQKLVDAQTETQGALKEQAIASAQDSRASAKLKSAQEKLVTSQDQNQQIQNEVDQVRSVLVQNGLTPAEAGPLAAELRNYVLNFKGSKEELQNGLNKLLERNSELYRESVEARTSADEIEPVNEGIHNVLNSLLLAFSFLGRNGMRTTYNPSKNKLPSGFSNNPSRFD